MSLQLHLERALESVPFLATLGIRVAEARPGEVTLGLPHQRGNTNHAGGLHSGAVFAVGELAATIALGTHPRLATLTQRVKLTQIRYVSPATGAVTAQAIVDAGMVEAVVAALASEGRALLEVPVRVRDGEGADVADLLVGFAFRS